MAATDPPTLPIGIDWSAALAEHGRWLRTVVRARIGELQGVDEVMQEVSLAAVSQRAPIADPSRLGAWLYRVAVRQALLYRRAQGRRRRLAERYALVSEARDRSRGIEPDPLSWLLAAERDAMVRKSIEGLPSRDRELLLLKYTEDWSYRELAQRLGLTESAVEARLHRARARLRERLDRILHDRETTST